MSQSVNLVFCSSVLQPFCIQSHQCKLQAAALAVRGTKTDSMMPAGEYDAVRVSPNGSLLVWSTCGYFDKRKPEFLARNWPIALPFTQRKVFCMMFQLQRGCPGVCTACQAL